MSLDAAANPICECCNNPVPAGQRSYEIFDEYGQFRRIQFLLAECVQRVVSQVADGRVQVICSDCLDQLELNYAFKLKCQRNAKPAAAAGGGSSCTGLDDVAGSPTATSELDDLPANTMEAINSIDAAADDDDNEDASQVLDADELEEVEEEEEEELDVAQADDDDDDADSVDHDVRAQMLGTNEDMDLVDCGANIQPHDNADLSDGGEFHEEYVADNECMAEPIAHSDGLVVTGSVTDDDDDDDDNQPAEANFAGFVGTSRGGCSGIMYVSQGSFVDSLSVHSIKEKIRAGIPIHPVASASGDDGGNVNDEVESEDDGFPLDDELPIDLDDYLKSIVSISFCEYSPFVGPPDCSLCESTVRLECYTALLQHTEERHVDEMDGRYRCCLAGCRELCNDLDEFNNHLFVQHNEVINACCFLTCQTCELVTESLVKFGKHICNNNNNTNNTASIAADNGAAAAQQPIAVAEQPVLAAASATISHHQHHQPYACRVCRRLLGSPRRLQFHQQFHRLNARPKVCLICEHLFCDERRFYEHVQFGHDQFAQHACRHCDRSFTLPAELRRHEHAHTAVRRHLCAECGSAFFDTATLSAHWRSQHGAGFTCAVCAKHFTRKFRLRKHMAQHVRHEAAVLPVCQRCGRVFGGPAAVAAATGEPSTTSVTQHHECCSAAAAAAEDDSVDAAAAAATVAELANERVQQAFCCEYCEWAFARLPQLVAHKATHEADDRAVRFRCAHCPRRFAAYGRLRAHANAHPEARQPFAVQRQYVCELSGCHKPYADWHNYQTHRKTVHLINPSIIRCTLCDEVFYKSWLYAYHVKSVHQRHKRCAQCGQTFVLQRALDQHMRKAHAGQPPASAAAAAAANNQAADDDRTADELAVNSGSDERGGERRRPQTGRVLLDVHYSANRDGGYRCLECGKLSARRSNAVAHVQMVHMKVRNFTCPRCPQTFYHRGDLNHHLKMHDAITPFQCTYCDHKVRTKSMLKVHIRTHTNERPFQCPHCPKAFKRSMVLKNHIKLHAGIKEFACHVCALTFYTKYSLSTHCKKKHCPDNTAREDTTTKLSPIKLGAPKKSRQAPQVIIVMPGPIDRNEEQ